MIPVSSTQSYTNTNQRDQAQKIIKEVGIPMQPRVLFEINRLTSQGDPDFDQVAALIRKDVALSAKILKLAGSPMFAAGAQFESVTDALMILGIGFFKRCVITAAMERAMSCHGYDMKKFWFHSTLISSLCHKLAVRYCPIMSDKAYTLGLFHDVGAVVLAKFKSSYSGLIDQALLIDFESEESEYQFTGSDHATVGKIFSQKWALSPTISEAIQYHHSSDYDIHQSEETKQLKGILQLAELLFAHVSNREILALAPDDYSEQALHYIQTMFDIGTSELEDLNAMVHEVLSERF